MGLSTWDWIKLTVFVIWPAAALVVGLVFGKIASLDRRALDREIQVIEDFANTGGAR